MAGILVKREVRWLYWCRLCISHILPAIWSGHGKAINYMIIHLLVFNKELPHQWNRLPYHYEVDQTSSAQLACLFQIIIDRHYHWKVLVKVRTEITTGNDWKSYQHTLPLEVIVKIYWEKLPLKLMTKITGIVLTEITTGSYWKISTGSSCKKL